MNWVKAHKVWSTVIGFLVLVIIISAASGNNTSYSKPKSSTKSQQSQKTATTQAAAPTIPQYSFAGSSGSVHVYVISPSDVTEDKLTALGKNLYAKFSSDKIARISIFADTTQAKIMADNPLAPANLEGDAATAYDKAYVAQINTNKNTGLKEFFIYLQGLDGPSKQISL